LSRGIDLSTVDFVINFDSPFTPVEYFHRVGRTGRYFTHGVSISFFQENEIPVLDEIKSKDELSKMKETELDDETLNDIKNDFGKIF
jgi:superfamily II DNA/RNA helicase